MTPDDTALRAREREHRETVDGIRSWWRCMPIIEAQRLALALAEAAPLDVERLARAETVVDLAAQLVDAYGENTEESTQRLGAVYMSLVVALNEYAALAATSREASDV